MSHYNSIDIFWKKMHTPMWDCEAPTAPSVEMLTPMSHYNNINIFWKMSHLAQKFKGCQKSMKIAMIKGLGLYFMKKNS